MAPPTLLDQLVDHLRARGLARLPGEAGPGPRPWLPPFWRAPAEGVPAPGERTGSSGKETDDGLVIAGRVSGGIAPDAGEGYARRRTVDIDFRSKRNDTIEEWETAYIRELAPPIGDPALDGSGIPGLRIDWQMAGVRVIESRLWGEVRDLGSSEAQGYHHRIVVLFETYL